MTLVASTRRKLMGLTAVALTVTVGYLAYALLLQSRVEKTQTAVDDAEEKANREREKQETEENQRKLEEIEKQKRALEKELADKQKQQQSWLGTWWIWLILVLVCVGLGWWYFHRSETQATSTETETEKGTRVFLEEASEEKRPETESEAQSRRLVGALNVYYEKCPYTATCVKPLGNDQFLVGDQLDLYESSQYFLLDPTVEDPNQFGGIGRTPYDTSTALIHLKYEKTAEGQYTRYLPKERRTITVTIDPSTGEGTHQWHASHARR